MHVRREWSEVLGIWGFPKSRGTLLGVLRIETIFWGVCIGNYHMA